MQPDKRNDPDHWARVHIISDRSKPVDLPNRPVRPSYVFPMWAPRKKKEPAE